MYVEPGTPTNTPTPRTYQPEEDCIPSLNDILAASFANVSITKRLI